jgi:hypothetical protein
MNFFFSNPTMGQPATRHRAISLASGESGRPCMIAVPACANNEGVVDVRARSRFCFACLISADFGLISEQ